MTVEEQFYSAIEKVISDYRLVGEVSPSWIATQVMQEIEFPRSLHELGYIGCHLEVRQIARGKLRKKFDPEERIKDSVGGQGEFFPDTLQERYPRYRSTEEEPIYALRHLLTHTDIHYNVERMRRGGRALLKHADALEAWDAERRNSAA